MRSTRNQAKRAAKRRYCRHQALRSTDGPQCPHCEPHVNGKLSRYTHLARVAHADMNAYA